MNDNEEKDEVIEWETDLNQKVLDLIFELYDETFKDLVNR